MNLENKTRLTKDIIVYENFIDVNTAAKIVTVLDRHADLGKLTWTPISFYESYSSTLPQDGDEIVAEEGLPPTVFSDIKSGIISAVASVHELDPSIINQIGYHTQKW